MTCQLCGAQAPTHRVRLQTYTALLIGFRRTIEGDLCWHCIQATYRRCQLHCLFLGWLGILSIIVNPLILIDNTMNHNRAKRALLPDGHSAWHPALVLLLAILVAAIIVIAIVHPRSSLPINQFTPTPAPSACTSWRDAPQLVGSYHCLCGAVVNTYADPNSTAFFIGFSNSPDSFYAVSFEYYWNDLKGQCVQVCGVIDTYRNRPQIIIRDPATQLFACP